MNPCIAYLDNGNICGRPAECIDNQRGGMVCWVHSQVREVQRTEARRGLAHFDAIREGLRDFNEDLGAEGRRAAARDDREGWSAEADHLAHRRREGL